MDSTTRVAILLATERLFAERGFGVSMREIGVAAGQRNHSAVQYHFGGREQLVNALFEYRIGPLDVRRRELVEKLRAAGQEQDLASLVDAYIRPLAEHALAHRGSSWYLRLLARLAVTGLDAHLPLDRLNPEGIRIVATLIVAALPGLTDGRMMAMHLNMTAVLAHIEQRCDDPTYTDAQAAAELADLFGTTVALLTTPPADATVHTSLLPAP